MGSIPTLAQVDTRIAIHDKEWRFHSLPNENVEIPRRHVPDPEAESVPTLKQESAAELERRSGALLGALGVKKRDQ